MSDAPLPYFYRLSPPTGYYEMAALEFQALTGDPAPAVEPWEQREEPTDVPRIAWSRAGVDIQRAAYVAQCCRLLANAEDLEGLLSAAEKLHLRRDRFQVRVQKRGGVQTVDSQHIERMLADRIDGSPDLSRPLVRLIIMARPGRWLMGELVSRTDSGWRGHEQRPYQYSSALPPRLARALVNLVARPGDRLMDPCCGVGTVLVEAAHMGVEAFGWDTNRRVVEHAASNLCHHGLGAWLVVGDGRTVRGRFDGAVLDLPYGQSTPRVESVCRGLVERALQVARHVAVVAIEDMRELLRDLGAEVLGCAALTKGNLIRRVHWARAPSAGKDA
ncbi:MAG: DNA methyltransferase [Armatimonadota bacterium]